MDFINYVLCFGAPATTATAAADGTQQGGNWWIIVIYLVIFAAIIYFLMIRPQKKQRQQQQDTMNAMEPGDSVLTTSGFYGTIVAINGDTVIVEFGNNKNCRIPMSKQAISQVEKANAAYAAPQAAPAEEPKKKFFGRKKAEAEEAQAQAEAAAAKAEISSSCSSSSSEAESAAPAEAEAPKTED